MAVRLEVTEVRPLQGAGVRCFQHNGRCGPDCEGLGPSRRAQAPMVTGCQAVEPDTGLRRGQVVADRLRELKELLCHHRAHGVDTVVAGVRVATAVTEPAGEGSKGTRFKLATEHIAGHGSLVSQSVEETVQQKPREVESSQLDAIGHDLQLVDLALEALDTNRLDEAETRVAELVAPSSTPSDSCQKGPQQPPDLEHLTNS